MGKEKLVMEVYGMGALATTSRILKASTTTYVTAADVIKLLECKKNKAYQTIKEVNNAVMKDGQFAYEQRKASKYIFAEKFEISMDVVNAVIEKTKNRGRFNGILYRLSCLWCKS